MKIHKIISVILVPIMISAVFSSCLQRRTDSSALTTPAEPTTPVSEPPSHMNHENISNEEYINALKSVPYKTELDDLSEIDKLYMGMPFLDVLDALGGSPHQNFPIDTYRGLKYDLPDGRALVISFQYTYYADYRLAISRILITATRLLSTEEFNDLLSSYPLKTELNDDSVLEQLEFRMPLSEVVSLIGGCPHFVSGIPQPSIGYKKANGDYVYLSFFAEDVDGETIYFYWCSTTLAADKKQPGTYQDSRYTTPMETTVPQTTE